MQTNINQNSTSSHPLAKFINSYPSEREGLDAAMEALTRLALSATWAPQEAQVMRDKHLEMTEVFIDIIDSMTSYRNTLYS